MDKFRGVVYEKDVDKFGQKEYKFKYDDLVALGEKNPALKTKHGKIFKQMEFPCSLDIIRLIPFDAVRRWNKRNWNSVSRYLSPLKRHVEQARNRDAH